jgi:hypothetical protein
MLHNYPTPLVGYGASCILGYLLTALALPALRRGEVTQALAAKPSNPAAPGTWRIAPSAH